MTRTLPKQLETREAKSQSTRLLTEKATHRSAALRSQSWKVTASPVWTDLLPLTVSARLPSPGGKYNQDERDALFQPPIETFHIPLPRLKGHSGLSRFLAKTGYSERCFERTAKGFKETVSVEL